jgi:hypothetical protein
MHTHILRTDKTEYTVITSSSRWDWEEFLVGKIEMFLDVVKITTRAIEDNGDVTEATFK